jgi:hypothetical protein
MTARAAAGSWSPGVTEPKAKVMPHESTWRRASMGAKAGLGVVVVLGATAYSVPGRAVTFLGDKSLVGSAALSFAGDRYLDGSNNISVNDGWTVNLTANDARVGWFGKYTLHSDGNLVFDQSDGAGSWKSVVAGEDMDLATTFAPSAIRYRVYDGSGSLNVDDAGLSTKLSAVMPLSTSLVLLLTGLAGVGFLGRYKVRWRQPA